MRIFLVGFMGCGKTTLGSKLAAKLNYEFIDLDKVIENQAGMSIADYFKRFGESAFREFESDILKNLTYPENAIVATGGGTPCFFDNMDWMNENGITVYISAPSGVLAHRLKHSKTPRPLLSGKNENELVEFITEKLKEREPFYQKAQYSVNGAGLTAEKLIDVISMNPSSNL